MNSEVYIFHRSDTKDSLNEAQGCLGSVQLTFDTVYVAQVCQGLVQLSFNTCLCGTSMPRVSTTQF